MVACVLFGVLVAIFTRRAEENAMHYHKRQHGPWGIALWLMAPTCPCGSGLGCLGRECRYEPSRPLRGRLTDVGTGTGPVRSVPLVLGRGPCFVGVAGTGVPGASASEADAARTPAAAGGARWCLGSLLGFFAVSITRAGACVAGGAASTLADWPAPDGPAASGDGGL